MSSSETEVVPQAAPAPGPVAPVRRTAGQVVGGTRFLIGAGVGAVLGAVAFVSGLPWLAVPAVVALGCGLVAELRRRPVSGGSQETRLRVFYYLDDGQVDDVANQIEHGRSVDWAQIVAEIEQQGVHLGRFGVGVQAEHERRSEVLRYMQETDLNRFEVVHAYLRGGSVHADQQTRPFDPASPPSRVPVGRHLEVTVRAADLFGQGDLDWVAGDLDDTEIEVAGNRTRMKYVLARGKGTRNKGAARGQLIAFCRVEDVAEVVGVRVYTVRVIAVYREPNAGQTGPAPRR